MDSRQSPSPSTARIRLGTLLALPILIPIAAAGLISYLSLRNGQESVNDVASQLRTEVSTRIREKLTTFLTVPLQINQMTADAISRGEIQSKDNQLAPDSERYFAQQAKLFTSMSLIYFGDQNRVFAGGYPANDTLPVRIDIRDKSTGYRSSVFGVNAQGQRTQRLSGNTRVYDPRIRPWYIAAQKAGKPVWSEIYVDFTSRNLVITASQPFFNPNQTLKGVSAVDLYLADIGKFLSQIKIGKSGQVFVIERSGLLVSNSTNEPLLTPTVEGKDPDRIRAIDSANPLTQAVAKYVLDQFATPSAMSEGRQLEFSFQEQRQFLEVQPFRDDKGIDWLIVTAVPESDFLEQIAANTQSTILLSLLTLAVTGLVGFLIVRRISRPIEQLTEASQAIAAGRLDQRIGSQPVVELDVLAQSFNQMGQQLEESFASLEQRSTQLQVVSSQIQEESDQLQTDVGHILDVVSSVEEGDLTVQAQVSDRATGLVADTLNRLIEQLGQVLLQVQQTAMQVSTASDALETLAKTVALNAQQQAQEIIQALLLSEQVQQSAHGSSLLVDRTNRSLQTLKTTVETGKAGIQNLTQSIDILQQGSDRITQRMKVLGEFVGLADQFVQDQSQIASQTQVLSINASLVAARSAEQRDPRQFMVVAREFEAISEQVSALALQTNEGLGSLQQRTESIRAVVAAVDSEIQSLGSLVSGFTTGVTQSTQAFSDVETVTAEISQVGQQVAQANQSIETAALTTAQALQQVAALAEQTATLTTKVRLQSGEMDGLSSRLLDSIRFFRLPDPQQSSTDPPTWIDLSQSGVPALTVNGKPDGSGATLLTSQGSEVKR